jgi:hypothetical protein
MQKRVSVQAAVGGARRLGEVIDSAGEQMVELWSFTAEDGTDHLELVEHHWGSGIGWYPQKRMVLDADQIASLKTLLDRVTVTRPAPSAPSPARAEHEDNVILLPFLAS